MRKFASIVTGLIVFSLALCAAPAVAQESKTPAPPTPETKPDVHYYHLEFVLKELDENSKVVNSRTYHTDVSTDGKLSSVRTGTKIPIRTNDKAGEIQYLDVGVSIDCSSAQETVPGLGLQIKVEISSLANPPASAEASTPIVRQNRWQSMTQLPIAKPTVVFSSDNLENKGRMQVEVTAHAIH